MGLELRVIPLGHDVTAVIHVVTVAIRAALIFGNVQPGDLAGLLAYTKERVPAFVNTFGDIDPVVVSAGAGAIALGFPVVVDVDLGENQVPGALESCTDHSETVKKSLELRGIKIKSKELPIPVAFAAAFEGEIIRKADMQVEFWSAKNTTCELVQMKDASEVEDHKITVDGPDIDSGELEYALATCIYVAGKKMQADFESVIERKIHAWFNYMEGVMHTGQRNQFRIRISKDAYEHGLRLHHFGEVLYHMIMDEFDAVVDKCEVRLITDPEKATKFLNEVAMPRYNARDDRLASMTDESVDRFFTCILCQSFAPAHCCVVTPERLGLCGAVSWLDAKATYELNPNGPVSYTHLAKAVADAVTMPIVIMGCKNIEKDTELFNKIAEALAGKNILVLSARDENYKTVGASAGLALSLIHIFAYRDRRCAGRDGRAQDVVEERRVGARRVVRHELHVPAFFPARRDRCRDRFLHRRRLFSGQILHLHRAHRRRDLQPGAFRLLQRRPYGLHTLCAQRHRHGHRALRHRRHDGFDQQAVNFHMLDRRQLNHGHAGPRQQLRQLDLFPEAQRIPGGLARLPDGDVGDGYLSHKSPPNMQKVPETSRFQGRNFFRGTTLLIPRLAAEDRSRAPISP